MREKLRGGKGAAMAVCGAERGRRDGGAREVCGAGLRWRGDG